MRLTRLFICMSFAIRFFSAAVALSTSLTALPAFFCVLEFQTIASRSRWATPAASMDEKFFFR